SIYVFTMATIYISSTFYILFILDLVGFAQLGLLVSIGYLFQAILDYPTGVVADWIGHKWVLAVSYAAHAVSYTFLAFASHINSDFVFEYLVIVYCLEAFALAQESGAMQAWFDNNYKITAVEEDKDRTTYREIFGKTIMAFRLLGGLAILFGGLIADQMSRETVFLIQAGLMLISSFIFVFALNDFPEIEKVEASMKNLGKLLIEGVEIIFKSRTLFFFVLTYVTIIVVNFTWISLIIYPLYFGYTGSDGNASTLRSLLFIVGSLITIAGISLSKRLNNKYWPPIILVFHALIFYGSYALVLDRYPLEDELNWNALGFVFLIAMVGNLTTSVLMLLLQRFMVDIVPDKNRNSFYSLSPTLGLIFSSITVYFAGNYLETTNNLSRSVIYFMVIPALLSSLFLFLSLYDYQPPVKPVVPIPHELSIHDTSIAGLTTTFGLINIPLSWKIASVASQSWNNLIEIALRDSKISEDEKILLERIISDVQEYGQLLEDAIEDGIIDTDEQSNLIEKRHQLWVDAKNIALQDDEISKDEQKLLDHLISIIKQLAIVEKTEIDNHKP
ncbi:MAG: MFS transporter, partial [Candidatus Kariarchaeaceae archaeon]